jgi:hypothetical protein
MYEMLQRVFTLKGSGKTANNIITKGSTLEYAPGVPGHPTWLDVTGIPRQLQRPVAIVCMIPLTP